MLRVSGEAASFLSWAVQRPAALTRPPGGVASLERFKQKLGGQPRPMAEYRLERLPLSKLQDSTASALKRLESYVIDRRGRRSAHRSA